MQIKKDGTVPVHCPFCSEGLFMIEAGIHQALVCRNPECFCSDAGVHLRWSVWGGSLKWEHLHRYPDIQQKLEEGHHNLEYHGDLSLLELRDWDRSGIFTQLACPLCLEALTLGPEKKAFETLTEHVADPNCEDLFLRDVLICQNPSCDLADPEIGLYWSKCAGEYYSTGSFRYSGPLQTKINVLEAEHKKVFGETYGGPLTLDMGLVLMLMTDKDWEEYYTPSVVEFENNVVEFLSKEHKDED